jgi:hypothetical protein
MPERSAEQPPSPSLEQLESSYEEWFREWAAAQRGRCSGVYRAVGGKITIEETKPPRRWHNWLRGIRSFGFFPRTSIRSLAFRPGANEESLANDCALVGADLYTAIQECKKK